MINNIKDIRFLPFLDKDWCWLKVIGTMNIMILGQFWNNFNPVLKYQIQEPKLIKKYNRLYVSVILNEIFLEEKFLLKIHCCVCVCVCVCV